MLRCQASQSVSKFNRKCTQINADYFGVVALPALRPDLLFACICVHPRLKCLLAAAASEPVATFNGTSFILRALDQGVAAS
jgi:hypothetical protein